MIQLASSSFLSFLGLLSGSCIRSLDSPFCLLVLLLLKFFIDCERDSQSISSSSYSSILPESQFSYSDSSGSYSQSICKAFSISFCCNWSIKFSSSFSSSFSIQFSIYIQLGKLLSSSQTSEFQSSESFLLAATDAFEGFGLGSSCVQIFFYYNLSSGMLSPSERGIQPCSWAQCSFSKQKPMLMVILVDINVIYKQCAYYLISQIGQCWYLYTNTNQLNKNPEFYSTNFDNGFDLSQSELVDQF